MSCYGEETLYNKSDLKYLELSFRFKLNFALFYPDILLLQFSRVFELSK